MPVSGLTPGSIITAAQFNELVSLYDAYWKGGTYTYDEHHTSELVRRKGWGQPTVYQPVNPQTIITAEITNHLICQINAGLWHLEEELSQLQFKRDISTSVAATIYTQLENVYDNVIEPNKFNIDPSSKSVNTNIVATSNSSTPWQNDLYCEHKYTFASYDEARHFFNSGGEIIIDMSSTAGGTNNPSLVWNIFFDNLGIVRIGAESTTNDGDGDGDAPFNNSLGPKGFYHMNGLSTYTDIYNIAATGDGGGDSYGSSYGSYLGGGIYSQRRFVIALKGVDTGTAFEVHVKIKLLEDPDDGDIFVNANIIAELGYSQPLDTPEPSESSTHDYFSPVSGTDYIFAERTAPLIAMTVTWTDADF